MQNQKYSSDFVSIQHYSSSNIIIYFNVENLITMNLQISVFEENVVYNIYRIDVAIKL